MKQFRKRMLASGLAVTVMMGTTTPTIKVFANEQTATPRFNDVSESHWAKSQIDTFITEGVIAGYPDGSFKPNNKITRAEFVKIVNKAFGFTSAGEITFTDVKEDAWYKTDVAIAVKAGYLNGFEDGTFRPNEEITREQMAKILGTILNITGDDQTNFTDDSSIAPWAKKYVDGLVEKGVIQGYPDGTFKPKGNATRAEGVKLTSDSKTYNSSQNNNDSTQEPEEQKPSKPSTGQGTGTGGFFPNFGGSTGNDGPTNNDPQPGQTESQFETQDVVVVSGNVPYVKVPAGKTLKVSGNAELTEGVTLEKGAKLDIANGAVVTLSEKSQIEVLEGSQITVGEGSELVNNGELSLENGGTLSLGSTSTYSLAKSKDAKIKGKGSIKVGKGFIHIKNLADIEVSIIGVNKNTKLKVGQLWVVHPTEKDTALTINNYNTTLDFEFGATHQELGKVHTMTVNGGRYASLTFNDAWRSVVVKATEGANLELNAPSNWNYAVALLYKQGTTYGYEEAYKGKYTGNKYGSWTKEIQEPSIPSNPVITEATTNGTINDLQQIYTETIKTIKADGNITLTGTNEIKADQILNMGSNILTIDGSLSVYGIVTIDNEDNVKGTEGSTIEAGGITYTWENGSWVDKNKPVTPPEITEVTTSGTINDLQQIYTETIKTIKADGNITLTGENKIKADQVLNMGSNILTIDGSLSVYGIVTIDNKDNVKGIEGSTIEAGGITYTWENGKWNAPTTSSIVTILPSTTTSTITTNGTIINTTTSQTTTSDSIIGVTTSQTTTSATTTISTILNGNKVSTFDLKNLEGNLKIQFQLADKKSLGQFVINGYEIKLPQGLEINSDTLVTIELTKEQLKTLGLDENKEANELKIEIQEK